FSSILKKQKMKTSKELGRDDDFIDFKKLCFGERMDVEDILITSRVSCKGAVGALCKDEQGAILGASFTKFKASRGRQLMLATTQGGTCAPLMAFDCGGPGSSGLLFGYGTQAESLKSCCQLGLRGGYGNFHDGSSNFMMKKDTEHEIHNEVQLPGRLSGDDSSNLKMECCILEILCVLATGTHTSEDTDFSRWFADYPICDHFKVLIDKSVVSLHGTLVIGPNDSQPSSDGLDGKNGVAYGYSLIIVSISPKSQEDIVVGIHGNRKNNGLQKSKISGASAKTMKNLRKWLQWFHPTSWYEEKLNVYYGKENGIWQWGSGSMLPRSF
ncbi:hypothetical protein IFM89_028753, partial [Coptis chinensis]